MLDLELFFGTRSGFDTPDDDELHVTTEKTLK